MKTQTTLPLFSVLFLALVLAGCNLDPNEPTFEQAYLQFAPVTGNSVTRSLSLGSPEAEPFTETLTIQLAGASQSSATSVSFEMNGATTAVEGTHYELVTSGGTLTIPANEHFAQLEIRILPAGFDAGEGVVIAPSLTDASDFEVMENFRTFYLEVEMDAF